MLLWRKKINVDMVEKQVSYEVLGLGLGNNKVFFFFFTSTLIKIYDKHKNFDE